VVVELQALGLRERALEAIAADGRGQVEQRARDRRDRDAFVGVGVTGIEGTRPMQAHPRRGGPASRRGDIDQRRLAG
jgi:hypothetical protein